MDVLTTSLDVLTTSPFGNKIVWYENTGGRGNFRAQRVIGNDAGRING